MTNSKIKKEIEIQTKIRGDWYSVSGSILIENFNTEDLPTIIREFRGKKSLNILGTRFRLVSVNQF